MARAKLACSDCGNELLPDDRFCSKCGAKVDDTAAAAPQTSTKPTIAKAICEVCGHANVHGGMYCEACGSKLPARAGVEQKDTSRPSKNNATSTKKTQPANNLSSSFKFEPWHYTVGAIVLAVVGFFVHIEFQREYPTSDGAQPQSAGPMQFPASQTPSTPPTKEILAAIDRLQKTVNENPNDAGAKLLLANALHDGAMHDGTLFPQAIEAYKSYLKDKPGDPNARVDLGICYFELGKIDSTQTGVLFSMAINEMGSAVKSNPSHQPGAFNLAIVYLYSGNMMESNKWLQKTVELNAGSDLGKRAKEILEQHNQAG